MTRRIISDVVGCFNIHRRSLSHELAPKCVAEMQLLFVTPVILILFLSNVCVAQLNNTEPNATSDVDRSDIQIADPFHLMIEVTAPQGTQVNFPELPDSLGSFDVLDMTDRFDIPQRTDPGMRKWTRRITLETIATGQVEIPGFEITILKRKDNNSQILRTDPITIAVASVVEDSADPTKFRDIAALHDVKLPDSTSLVWVWWFAGGAALAMVSSAVFLRLTRSSHAGDPANWALKELADFSDEDFPRLELVLRSFVAERFDFPAESHTSESILRTLNNCGVGEIQLSNLREILEKSERSKFGGLTIQPSETAELVAKTQDLIQQLDQSQEVS